MLTIRLLTDKITLMILMNCFMLTIHLLTDKITLMILMNCFILTIHLLTDNLDDINELFYAYNTFIDR